MSRYRVCVEHTITYASVVEVVAANEREARMLAIEINASFGTAKATVEAVDGKEVERAVAVERCSGR